MSDSNNTKRKSQSIQSESFRIKANQLKNYLQETKSRCTLTEFAERFMVKFTVTPPAKVIEAGDIFNDSSEVDIDIHLLKDSIEIRDTKCKLLLLIEKAGDINSKVFDSLSQWIRKPWAETMEITWLQLSDLTDTVCSMKMSEFVAQFGCNKENPDRVYAITKQMAHPTKDDKLVVNLYSETEKMEIYFNDEKIFDINGIGVYKFRKFEDWFRIQTLKKEVPTTYKVNLDVLKKLYGTPAQWETFMGYWGFKEIDENMKKRVRNEDGAHECVLAKVYNNYDPSDPLSECKGVIELYDEKTNKMLIHLPSYEHDRQFDFIFLRMALRVAHESGHALVQV